MGRERYGGSAMMYEQRGVCVFGVVWTVCCVERLRGEHA